MKSLSLFLLALILCSSAFAQRTVQMKNIWTRPQVHVSFEGYSVSFTIKDINRALELLEETGDSTFGSTCGLDTAKDFFIDLLSGNHMEYHNKLQPLLQSGVGAFLLTKGLAYLETPKHKKIMAITMDIVPSSPDEPVVAIWFYDPKTGDRVFSGSMAADMYNKDMGIDY